MELNAFGDASEVAYATAIYVRVVPKEGKASTSLVMSKTRVALVRKISLPRLELMAAVITARLCIYVKDAIDCPISRIVCWTDNSSTLHWIRGSPHTGNHLLLTVSWRFSRGWILVFGDIAQGRIIQQIYLAEAYLSASLERVSCGGRGPLGCKSYIRIGLRI